MTDQAKKAPDSATRRKRPTGATPDTSKYHEALHARITNLENCLAKMAHFSGSERVLDEFDIERWTVTKESMQKFRGK